MAPNKDEWKRIPEKLVMDDEVREIVEAAIAANDAEIQDLLVHTARKELERICDEIAQRQCETLNLYVPKPIQNDFHKNNRFIRLALGSNRGGKTLAAAIEAGRCLTNQDPFKKHPPEGIMYALGINYKHVGNVMWKKLSRFGAMKMVRDPKDGNWRAWNPSRRWDKANEHLAKPAPPIIPPRFIKSIAWEDKKLAIPLKVDLTTGWELQFFSCDAQPGQGFDIDRAWFDEEIDSDHWITEILRGLIDRRGSLWWSATPQAATLKLYEFYEQALDPSRTDTAVFEMFIKDNQYLSDEAKQQFRDTLSPAEMTVRWEGKFALNQRIVYPEWDADAIHSLVRAPGAAQDYQVPSTWAKWLIIDPGRHRCGVLGVAVPPDDSMFLVFDELYIADCDATTFADKAVEKFGHGPFEDFIIDWHMARQHQMGSGETIASQYSRELARVRVESKLSGFYFRIGSDDVSARTESFRKLLRINGETGSAKLKVFVRNCPNFCWEMKRQYYQKKGDLVTDKRVDKDNHLVTCGEMAAAGRLKWSKPAKPKKKEPWTTKAIREKKKRHQQAFGGGGGPSVRCAPAKGKQQ